MKTAIVYSTTHGTTEKVAGMLSKMSISSTELFNLKKVKDVNLRDYDKIIIGGSIHAGNVQKRIKKFCENHMHELTVKPIGLFLSCMDEDKAVMQFENAYPEELRKIAVSSKLTGGEVLFERMNFLEKFMMKKIGKMTESVSKLKEDKIRELAQEMGLC